MSDTRAWAASEGSATPQGVTWIPSERAYNFGLYSKHAERVSLLLFHPEDLVNPVLVRDLPSTRNKSGRIWHCRIGEEELGEARFYAYRVDGPEPERRTEWHAFDPDKVLFDPYARCVHFPPEFERGAATHPGFNGGRAPLGVMPSEVPDFDWGDAPRPRHDHDLVIYELHVRGFTRSPTSGVDEAKRGTFLGLIERIPYLQELGVTAVELMPIFQFDPQEGNFWGYMPISFFAPHRDYATAAGDPRREFKTLVRALHEAGIEVILDVVYNHTGEGSGGGPTYNLRGIDNSTYYLMTGDPEKPYADFSATGNTIHAANAQVRKLILDSLRFWVEEMHVDGFRFDLATTLARDHAGHVDLLRPSLLDQIASDPVLSGVRLIAEPWDADGYHLGRGFPAHQMAQWNDRYRIDLRRFLRGDAGMVGSLVTRLYGSDDLFPGDRMHAFRPCQSVNSFTSHDGFTLYDLVSYTEKRNWANGQANADGQQENHSWNCGWEGDDGVGAEVRELRRRQSKNFCCLLLLSNGTAMLRAGDEFLHTQGGNNNPYNQDNPTSWLDWSRIDAEREVLRFFRRMIAFRKAHPSISRSRFWREDVHWHGPSAEPDYSAESRQIAYFLSGASERDDDLYVMINSAPESIEFEVAEPGVWKRAIDTSLPSPEDIVDDVRGGAALEGLRYSVSGRSVVALVRERVGRHARLPASRRPPAL
jgi:isoamylase